MGETSGGTARDRGAALMKLGKFGEAAAAFRQAVEADPNDEVSWRLLGGALASRGDQTGAVTAFERAVEIGPGSAKNHYNLAVALHATDRLYEAKSRLEQALALDPNYAQARGMLDSLAAASADRSYGAPHTTAEAAPKPPSAAPRPYPAASSDDGLAPVGGFAATPAGGAPAAGRMQSLDDLAPVGGPQSAYAPGPAPSGEGVGVPNLAPSVPAGAGTYVPPPVLGLGYGHSDNTSGMKGAVPVEIQNGWNWGAFYFRWIWLFNHGLPGLAVGTLVAEIALGFLGMVLPFVGFAGLGIGIYLGVVGNRLGWQNRRFQSLGDFKECQLIWAKWALGIFLAGFVLGILIFVLVFFLVGAAALSGGAGGTFRSP